MLIDSHCHLARLDLEKYQGDLNLAIEAAQKNDVGHFLAICVNLPEFPNILDIAKRYACVSCSVGVHPSDHDGSEVSPDELTNLASESEVVALGETGLDYFYNTEKKDRLLQQLNFRHHIQVGHTVKKPIIIHSREASNDMLMVMREENIRDAGGVMHCFTDTWEMAKKVLDLGFYVSISGIVTFKKADQIKEVARKVPLDRLLIETDAPYLAPVPFRGKSNEPAYVKHVAECVAALRGVSYEGLAQQTTQNFCDLFKVNLHV